MRTSSALLTAAVVLGSALGLGACSGSDAEAAYCAAAGTNFNAETMKSFSTDDPAAVKALAASFRTVAAAAPQDIKDDWQALAGYMQDFAAAEGNTDKLKELETRSEQIVAATAEIQKSLKEECGITD